MIAMPTVQKRIARQCPFKPHQKDVNPYINPFYTQEDMVLNRIDDAEIREKTRRVQMQFDQWKRNMENVLLKGESNARDRV
jgi:hypothetical protein